MPLSCSNPPFTLNQVSLATLPAPVRVLVISDIHFGKVSVPAGDLVEQPYAFFDGFSPTSPMTALSLIVFAGDVFDKEQSYSNPAVFAVQQFMREFLLWAGKHQIVVRFLEGTPLHDGAVVIRDGVIVAAGCVLPLSNNLEMGKDMGTRHRAGLGMSENSDAIVVIVSEETGIISMAKNGVLIRRLDRQNLFNLLQEEIVPPAEDEEADISPLQKLLRKGGAMNHAKPE
mgnify:CR=1 FL=1